MSGNVEIREPISEQEIDAVSRLWCITFHDLATHTDEDLDRWYKVDEARRDSISRLAGLNNDILTLVAVEDGRLLGAISGYRRRASDSLVDLEIMAVEQEQRKGGVGKQLVLQFMDVCSTNRVKAIHFDTAELAEQGSAVEFWDHLSASLPIIKKGTVVYEDGEAGLNGVYYKIQLKGNTW